MKIRYKIALWITGVGLIVSLIFTSVVLLELSEQPNELIDTELNSVAGKMTALLDFGSIDDTGALHRKMPLISRYWIKAFDSNRKLLFQSSFAQAIDLPFIDQSETYEIPIDAPPEIIKSEVYSSGEAEEEENISFIVKTVHVQQDGESYIIQIALPVESPKEEFSEIFQIIAIGTAFSVIVLLLLSYLVAGRILQPIRKIYGISQKINEKNLDSRVPLGKNKDELYDLSVSLNDMFDRLQYSFELQKQFLADAAHELRTPLASLKLSLEETLQMNELPEETRRNFSRNTEILQRLERLVKSLLDLSSLELKKNIHEYQQIPLFELLNSIGDEFADFFAAQEISFSLDIPKDIIIEGNRDDLQHVFINLIDNAIKYNRPGGVVEVTASKNNNYASVSVMNSGPGISQEETENVFKQFYRIEKSRSTQYGGAGLGLTIAKRIIELHGGTISIRSNLNQATYVDINLPLTV
jgi:two-component system OmpR family sensor kinase